MFVSRIAPRMDRVTGANHPTAPRHRRGARARIAGAAKRVDDWTLEAFNPVHGRYQR